MSFDIRGAWKYRDLLEEYSELQVRASKKILSLQKERDDAHKIIDVATERFFREKEKLKKEHAEKVNRLETQAEEQHHSYESLNEYCKIIEDDAEKLKEKIKGIEAENKKLKKIRWRWLDAEHGWWPVEGADVDEMVKKVPYVPYAPKPKEKQVPES